MYMFNLIDIYRFIPVSVSNGSCVGMGPTALFCPGHNDAVKTALPVVRCRYWIRFYATKLISKSVNLDRSAVFSEYIYALASSTNKTDRHDISKNS